MINLVYPIGTNSKWNDNELRFSLRSVEKYVLDFDRIFIIGERPTFLSNNIIHIPCEDPFSNKARNIMWKILAACNDQRIGDRFLLMNDDYFFTNTVSVDKFPYYYHKTLEEKVVKTVISSWLMHVQATADILREKSLPTLNFDIHYPIIYNSSDIKKVITSYAWDIPYGYTMKSLYCNTLGINGVFKEDCKIKQEESLE